MNADEIKVGKRYRITERHTSGAVAMFEDEIQTVEGNAIYFKNLMVATYASVDGDSDLASVSIERMYEGLPDKVGTVVEDQDGLRWFLISATVSSVPTWYSEFGTTTTNSSFQASARQAALEGNDWTVIVEGKS